MKGTRALLFNVACLTIAGRILTSAEANPNTTEIESSNDRSIDIFPGVKLSLASNKVDIKFKIWDILPGKPIETRESSEGTEKTSLFKRFGTMVMMVPFAMQMLSLPGAIATIKMSLLKTIMVAKLAILMMIYNVFKNSKRSETVFVHRPEYHVYHYDPYHNAEEDVEGWLGRGSAR